MIIEVLTLLLGIAVIAAIIGANGYFVAQEFAYMSVDRNALRARAEAGDTAAKRALSITERTSFMLSGAQLGITVTGLLVGFLVEPLVGRSLGALLGGVGIPAAVSISVGTVLALAVATIVQMIFAELFPKNYAIAAPMKTSLALARSTSIYLKINAWVIRFFDVSANALLKVFRIEPIEDVDSSATAEDLDHIVATSRVTGALDDRTFFVVDRLLDFPDRNVGHAMIPRSRTDVVSPDDTVEYVLDLMAEGHTRYPVIDEQHTPVGIVHLADALGSDHHASAPVRTIMRPVVVMPELMALPDAVEQLQQQREKMSCVIDEYGGFIGIITLEDLAEEILGDVRDEHDGSASETLVAAGEHEWVVAGDTPLDEVERAINHDIPDGDVETVAGLVLAQAGQLVQKGEAFDIALPPEPEDFLRENAPARILRARVERVDRHVPAVVRLTVREQAPATQGTDEEDN